MPTFSPPGERYGRRRYVSKISNKYGQRVPTTWVVPPLSSYHPCIFECHCHPGHVCPSRLKTISSSHIVHEQTSETCLLLRSLFALRRYAGILTIHPQQRPSRVVTCAVAQIATDLLQYRDSQGRKDCEHRSWIYNVQKYDVSRYLDHEEEKWESLVSLG